MLGLAWKSLKVPALKCQSRCRSTICNKDLRGKLSISASGPLKAPAMKQEVELDWSTEALQQANRGSPLHFSSSSSLFPPSLQSGLPPGRDSDDGAFHPFNGLYVCGPRSEQLQRPTHHSRPCVRLIAGPQEIQRAGALFIYFLLSQLKTITSPNQRFNRRALINPLISEANAQYPLVFLQIIKAHVSIHAGKDIIWQITAQTASTRENVDHNMSIFHS